MRIDEPQDPPELVSLLECDDDVREGHGPAAKTDALDTFVVAEHAGGDRTFVAHFSKQQLYFADPAAATLAADPVAQPRPAQCAQQGLVRHGGHLHTVGL